jgi:hypothetical protein
VILVDALLFVLLQTASSSRPTPVFEQVEALTRVAVPGVAFQWETQSRAIDDQSREWLRALGVDRYDYATRIGYPLDSYERLFSNGPGESKQLISWPSDLRGLIEVHDRDQALSVLRVFSSVESWYRFPEFGYVEVTPVEEVGYRPSGPAGILKSEFQRLRLPELQVVEQKDGFRLLRPVLRLVDDRVAGVLGKKLWGIAILDEYIGRHGAYTLRVLWRQEVPQLDRYIQRLR